MPVHGSFDELMQRAEALCFLSGWTMTHHHSASFIFFCLCDNLEQRPVSSQSLFGEEKRWNIQINQSDVRENNSADRWFHSQSCSSVTSRWPYQRCHQIYRRRRRWRDTRKTCLSFSLCLPFLFPHISFIIEVEGKKGGYCSFSNGKCCFYCTASFWFEIKGGWNINPPVLGNLCQWWYI